ncbi:MAG TPA: glycosyltransferase family 9 protein [Candidatus Gastranaerophilales bacterium]|nr:glycosyltransferase family 9 protein [Candidatus Gastranaerophilales bacterium]
MRKNFLILNFGGLGDQILFLPVLQTIKKVSDESFITFITEPRSSSINRLTDYIDELFISDLKGKNKFFELLRILTKAFFGKYDTVISSGSSQLVSIILFLTGIKNRIGYDSGLLSRILLTKAVPLNQNQYASDMYHDLVLSFCFSKEAQIPEIKLSLNEQKKKHIENLISGSLDAKKIVIHPGVSKLSIQKGIIKFWTVDNWANFIKMLLLSGKYTVILTGGPDDREIFPELKQKISEIEFSKDHFLDLSDKSFNIQEFAYLVKISDMLVCVDSAPMHIAVGLKQQVTALFGPTDEAKLLPPNNNLFTAVKNDKATCRPCLWDKRQISCEKTDCLNISPEFVFDVLDKKFMEK